MERVNEVNTKYTIELTCVAVKCHITMSKPINLRGVCIQAVPAVQGALTAMVLLCVHPAVHCWTKIISNTMNSSFQFSPFTSFTVLT